MPDFDAGNWLTIAGWIVTFVLGICATLIVQRRGRERRTLKWAVASETSLLSSDVLGTYSTGFGVPIKVLVDGVEEANVTVLSLKIGNAGNVAIRDATLFFHFGPYAKLHVGRYAGDSKAYGQQLELTKETNSAHLRVGHLNPGSEFDFEFLLANYAEGDVTADLAEAGVDLKRVEYPNFGMFGIRYHAATSQTEQTARLADEVRSLRRVAELALRAAPSETPAAQQGVEPDVE